MKAIIRILAPYGAALLLATASPPVQGASDLVVLKVCQEDMLLRTSDGAEAGRITYVVMDPGSRSVVSVLVSGGVLTDRIVAVPFDSVRFGSGRDVTLYEIDQQRLISAPVIERTSLVSTSFDATVIERSRTHFTSSTTTSSATRRDMDRSSTTNRRTETTDPADPNARKGEATRPDGKARTDQDRRPGAGEERRRGDRGEDRTPAPAPAPGDDKRRADEPPTKDPAAPEQRDDKTMPQKKAESEAQKPTPKAEDQPAGRPAQERPGQAPEEKAPKRNAPDKAEADKTPGAPDKEPKQNQDLKPRPGDLPDSAAKPKSNPNAEAEGKGKDKPKGAEADTPPNADDTTPEGRAKRNPKPQP